MRTTHRFIWLGAMLACGVLAVGVRAGPPPLVGCQGRLVAGTNLVTGNVSLVLRLYDTVAGSNLLYEDSNTVAVVDGVYATFLGDNTTTGSLWHALSQNQVFLEVVADGAPYLPRQRIVSVAYAMVAAKVPPGSIGSNELQTACISAPQIADGTILAQKLSAAGSTNGQILVSDGITVDWRKPPPDKCDGHSLDACDGSPVDALFVDQVGRVGAGTTNPASQALLHLAKDTPIPVAGVPPYAQLVCSGTSDPDTQLRLGFCTQLFPERHGFIEACKWVTGTKMPYPLLVNSTVYLGDDGKVGIGTEDPAERLHLVGDARIEVEKEEDNAAFLYFYGGSAEWRTGSDYDGKYHVYHNDGSVADPHFTDHYFTIDDANGHVGIGTRDPTCELEVQSGDSATRVAINNVGLEAGDPQLHFRLYGTSAFSIGVDNSDGDKFKIGTTTPATSSRLVIDGSGNVGIGTSSPADKLDVRGTARVEELVITGGSDLAEPFDVGGGGRVEPGTVVSIDPQRPGRLTVCSRPYDRCVAGIVSGASGVKPGLVMGQTGTLAHGKHPVALSGRVYCRAVTTNGAIEPGDLLTSADAPGRAMRVTDHERSRGAVIGKAMTPLSEKEGMVLVLVSLQ